MPPLPVPVIELTEVGSTNTEMMQRLSSARLSATDLPLWLRAETQTAGRGRQGRSWQSMPGNMTASLGIVLDANPAHAHQLSMVAGLAVCDCVRLWLKHTPARTLVKWPNDVLVDGAKISGILCETTALPQGSGRAAVLGIGINLAHHPDDAVRATTSIAAWTPNVPSPATALSALSAALMARIAEWNNAHGFSETRAAWLRFGHQLGEPLTVHLNALKEAPSGPLAGRFAGLDADGALLLARPSGDVLRITYGDVALA